VNAVRAETFVLKKLLDEKLTKIGIEALENESAAIVAAFEENGSELTIQTFVHPQQ
jgi:hypothetical protein